MVTTAVLQPSAWVDTLDALGTVRANESVTITAKVSETVTRVHFDSGDQAKAGQVLVTLSGQAQQAALAEADADFKEAQGLFLREQDLARRQLIAASQFETQRAARDAAKARLDQARAQLSDRVITAPFAGVLGLRQVSEGALVTPGTVITTLDDVRTVRLDFTVPERFLSVLAVGQAVLASADAYPGQTFRGEIESLDSRIDPLTRAVQARARIPNADGRLRPGMLLRVSVQRAGRTTLQVPELALLQVGQQAFLFRVGPDDKVEQVPVTIGARRPGFVEIVAGVRAGERVVVEGTVKLHPGSTVVEAGADPGDDSGRAANSPKQD
jgi:membrane fusion protein (multidrug efflux system)